MIKIKSRIANGLSMTAGQALFANGTVALPSIAFQSEPTLGLYRNSAGIMATPSGKIIAIGGTTLVDTQYSLQVFGDTSAGRSVINLLHDKGADVTTFERIIQYTNEANDTAYGTTGISSNNIRFTAGNNMQLSFGAHAQDISFFNDTNPVLTAMTIQGTTGNIGIGVTTPNANAILDVTSTTKAFMPPRMTTAQRDAIASPTEGMVIYNTTTAVLNFRNATVWGAV